MSPAVRLRRHDDRLVELVLDRTDRPLNLMDDTFVAGLGTALDEVEVLRADIAGIVVTSPKAAFFAGGDIERLTVLAREGPAAAHEWVGRAKAQLRRLETLGRPVVAALGGSALGGGLELALACHHRIAVADPALRVGLPEVTLGLLPGGGGVVRTVRLLGPVPALSEVLLEGTTHPAARAHRLGLVDELVDDPALLLPRARAWITAHPDGVLRCEGPAAHADLTALGRLTAQVGSRSPAGRSAAARILAAAVEGAAVDTDTALRIESRHFVSLLCGPVATRLIDVTFQAPRRARADAGATADRVDADGDGTGVAALRGLRRGGSGADGRTLRVTCVPADASAWPDHLRPGATPVVVHLGSRGRPLVEIMPTPDAEPVRRALARDGAVPVPVRQPTVQRLWEAARNEARTMLAEGWTRASVRRAAAWAGLPDPARTEGPGTGRTADGSREAGQPAVGDAPARRAGGDGLDLVRLADRLLAAQASEAACCLHRRLVNDAAEADLLAVLGAGFPAHTGGPSRWLTDRQNPPHERQDPQR